MDGEAACMASGSIAASAALADAGIEMLGLIAACSACSFPSVRPSLGSGDTAMDRDLHPDRKEVWLDPDEHESTSASGTVVMACMPALGTVTSLRQTGEMSPATVSSVGFSPYRI